MAAKPFPVANSTVSYWRADSLDELDNYRSPDWPAESDIVIIGAGYAGASLAYHMLQETEALESRPSIGIIEAREACSGATGRNGELNTPRSLIRHFY